MREKRLSAGPHWGTLLGMTSVRASAYRRVLETLRDIGPANLWPAEEACVREAADALLFCRDLGGDVAAKDALGDLAIVGDALIDAGRWNPRRVQQLLDDVWACGPGPAMHVPLAA